VYLWLGDEMFFVNRTLLNNKELYDDFGDEMFFVNRTLLNNKELYDDRGNEMFFVNSTLLNNKELYDDSEKLHLLTPVKKSHDLKHLWHLYRRFDHEHKHLGIFTVGLTMTICYVLMDGYNYLRVLGLQTKRV
jgi:hypothetical protein